ncbi:MAG: hypothetical protein IPM29_32285 [Planctomycetes bacterium]|nr:hypothetical protein [Planctomycetota bacterium]
MTDSPQLAPVMRQVHRLTGGRRRARFVSTLAALVLPASCAIALATLCATPLGWIDFGALGLAVVAVCAAVPLIAAVRALATRVDPIAIAKRYDDAIGSRDLLSSALGVAEAQAGTQRASFVAAIREDAAAAAGRDVRVGFAPAPVRSLRWAWAPLAVAVVAMGAWYLDRPTPPAPPPPVTDAEVLAEADRLDELLSELPGTALDRMPGDLADRLRELAERLKNGELTRRDAMAEVARLSSQLDRERQDLDGKRLEMQERAARLAKGEDALDAKRDMDSGRFREAANKVKKKLRELEEQLREAEEKNDGKIDIEALKRRIQQLRELLAELEQLDALGNELGFTLDVLNVLDRIDGRLGKLRDFDGDTFDDVQLGRAPRRPAPPQDGQKPKRLLVAPSSDAGKGHVEKVLGPSRRGLSEGPEREVQMTEGEGRSSFGQVRTANDGSRSRTAYQEAFLAAKRAADDAIYRQDVPASYRRYIRDYFDRMQPDDLPAADAAAGEPAAAGDGR